MGVIKRLTAANENLTSRRTREQAQKYWAETHGKLVANNPNLRRYHHYFSVPEAYEHEPKPTFIGVSMFWRDEPFSVFTPFPAPDWAPVGPDDRQLFDRSPRWPFDGQWADIFGEEHVILDGETKPGMINGLFMVNRLAGLPHQLMFEYWLEKHADIAAVLPGLRRYTVNTAYLEGFARRGMTHDGWSEFWFDDYSSFHDAVTSEAWRRMSEDAATFLQPSMGIVIGTEYIQKDESWKPRDYGVNSLTEDQVRDRLIREGFKILAADPTAPGKIKAAAAANKLAVWTPDHLVTLDDSRIDARPEI